MTRQAPDHLLRRLVRGSKDFTRATLEKEGEILTHGIAAMPGKPSLLANCRGRLVAGARGIR